MRLRTIIGTALAAVELAHALAAPSARPGGIAAVRGGSIRFDDGGCALVVDGPGFEHVGSIDSYWEPDIFGGVFSYGFTQDTTDTTANWYHFVPVPC